MATILPSYSPPSTANIQPGLANASADVRNLVEVPNGPNARLAQLSNNIRRELTVANDGVTLNANADVEVVANATGGAFGFTLPPVSTQYKSIFVSKVDNSVNWVQINANGTDRIANISNPLLLPAETSVSLYVGGMGFELYPYDIGGTNQGWRIRNLRVPFVGFRAFKTDSTSITSTFQKVNFTNEDFDSHNTFVPGSGATQSRFNPKIPGRYHVYQLLRYATGTGTFFSRLSVNDDTTTGGIVTNAALTTTGADSLATQMDIVLNGTTDFVAVTTGSSTTRSLNGSSSNIIFGAHLISL